jgi:XTP/dITP diphosphohydrolase
MILLLGSNNQHKANEVRDIINSHFPGKFEIKILSEVLNTKHEVIEDAETLEENAFKKAYGYHKLTALPCFADDTGLEIDALNGEPGVHSARFSGEQGNDHENRKKVLSLLKDVSDNNLEARFRTIICFYDGERGEYIEGICNGRMIREERGRNGFGYDPIFIPNDYKKTFAEMDSEEKNKISHRGKAVRNFVTFLKDKYML